MKKTIALILVCVMVLTAFAACGEKDITGTITESDGGKSTVDVTKPETEGDESELELGNVSDGASYTNDFAKINFNLPDGWSFSSQEELMSLMNLSNAELFSEDKAALLEYAIAGTVYDMMAQSAAGENVMVMFENTSRYLGGALLSEDGYLDALESNFDMIQGMTYVIGDRGSVTLGGIDYKTLSSQIEGYAIYQEYMVRRVGKYMVCIALTGFNEASIEAMYDYFS